MRRRRAWTYVLAGVLLLVSTSVVFAQEASPIARLSARMVSMPNARNTGGVLVALNASGLPVTDLGADALQARVDGNPADVTFSAARPSIALTVAFLLDSSASPLVRGALANAVAEALQGLDVNRDTVSIVSTADPDAWEQETFSTAPDELRTRLNTVIQAAPDDSRVSLDQLAGAMRALSAEQRDTHVLLLLTNHPLASAASAATTLGSLRTIAADQSIQMGVIALSGAGGQGIPEALTSGTPNGRVEYALDATNQGDLTRRLGLVLAPALGARRFELGPLADGSHTLTFTVPGGTPQASATFNVSNPVVGVDAFETSDGPLRPGAAIKTSEWVRARPTVAAPIDSVEWTVDGRVTNVTSEPWALLLDPEQLGDGPHELSARIVSQTRPGPLVSTTFSVPTDVLRSVRQAVRSWGLIAALLLANAIVLLLFLRVGPVVRPSMAVAATEFPPTLRLNALGGKYVAPEVLHFPVRGKLRVGYHPPYMDNSVGNREFTKLPYQDVRGDDDAVRDLSRHVACIWRDPRTNDCYIQLGWPGPGEPINPKPQTQVFHFGRPQDATSEAFRLAHHDVVRFASGIEYVFNQVGLRDKATPEGRKLSPLDAGPRPAARVTWLNEERTRQTQGGQDVVEER